MHKKENTPFYILGVGYDATDEQVKAAYKVEVLKNHPDRNNDPNAEEQFKRIQYAYGLIKNKARRSQVLEIIRLHEEAEKIKLGSKPLQQQHQNFASFNEARSANQQIYISIFRIWFLELLLTFKLAIELDRIPFKAVVLIGIFFLINRSNISADGGFLFPILLGLTSAVAAELLQQISARLTRFRLRSKTNRYATYLFLYSMVGVILTFDLEGKALIPFIGDGFAKYRSTSWLLMFVSFYLWFLYCFMFDKHGSFGETILIWLGASVISATAFSIWY